MGKRRRLGQHLLRDAETLDRIVDAAEISAGDVVFEIGAGEGDLTGRLCRYAGRVVAAEVDRVMFEAAEERLKGYVNLKLILGDGFSVEWSFDVLVSNLPYSASAKFIGWLAGRRFKRAVVTVQREFADKVLAENGARNYRAVSVLAQASFHIQKLFDIGRSAFEPPPKVGSTVLLLRPRGSVPVSRATVSSLKTLFSFRGRRLSAAMRTLFKDDPGGLKRFEEVFGGELLLRRVERLTVDEALRVAEMLAGHEDER